VGVKRVAKMEIKNRKGKCFQELPERDPENTHIEILEKIVTRAAMGFFIRFK
jgi:hypothetical protein